MSEPNDYVAEAKAQISAVDQSSEVIAAMMVAQAIDRLRTTVQINTEALDNNAHAVRIADENSWHRQNK